MITIAYISIGLFFIIIMGPVCQTIKWIWKDSKEIERESENQLRE